MFALYGYTPKKSLKSLPNRQTKRKDCLVTVEIENNGQLYQVTRKQPIQIIIYEGNKEISKEWANSECQRFINNTFGTLEYWKNFRLIDRNLDSNVLEQGPTTLKKLLFSTSDSMFNNVKDGLMEIKRDRDKYNKDNVSTNSYYPSEKRLKVLKSESVQLQSRWDEENKEVVTIQTELRRIDNIISQQQRSKQTNETNLNQLTQYTTCYACKRDLNDDKRQSMVKEIETNIKGSDGIIKEQTNQRSEVQTNLNESQSLRDLLMKKKTYARELTIKLENRIKLKDYKYTNEDVLVIKEAIKELDNLTTYYLTESVKVLEPIINSILLKIGFEAEFKVDDKNKFSIVLHKEGADYTYDDLSDGQKLVMQIAFKLSLLMEQGESGLVIADEGLSSLDSDNLLHIIKIFEDLPFQLFIILHNFDNVPEGVKIINLNEEETNG